MKFMFLESWIWWVAIAAELLPTYLWQVRSDLAIESKNLRWMHRGLDKFILGWRLAFIYRRAMLICVVLLVVQLFLLGWLAAVVSFLTYFILAQCSAPIARHHAREILVQVAGNEALQKYLATGITD